MDLQHALLIGAIASQTPQPAPESLVATYQMSKPPLEAAQCIATNVRQLRGGPYTGTVRRETRGVTGLVVSGPNAAAVAMARLIPIDTYSLMRIRFTGREFRARSVRDDLLQGC